MENNIDNKVDETLERCLLSTPRKSFFLFAGAGSGKTHSLVLLLQKIRDRIGKGLLLQGKQVAVITFTNAATDEIINRLDYSPYFHISTIHSFVWDVIRFYQADIKRLYCQYIQEDIAELEAKLVKAVSKTTKTYLSNLEKCNGLKERYEKAQAIDKFVYNPNGSNPEYNALKHAEVIKISAQMIMESKMLQRIIAQRYPILLIDESQDTKKELVDAFFKIRITSMGVVKSDRISQLTGATRYRPLSEICRISSRLGLNCICVSSFFSSKGSKKTSLTKCSFRQGRIKSIIRVATLIHSITARSAGYHHIPDR